jgi:hypothetical protein
MNTLWQSYSTGSFDGLAIVDVLTTRVAIPVKIGR